MKPFIIFGLPRSRTFWLSQWLSCHGYRCAHEQARYVRSIEDVKSWLAQDYTGTAETGAAKWWKVVQHHRPGIATLVVRRDPLLVVESLLRLDMKGTVVFDRHLLLQEMRRLDRRLDQIEQQAPNVLSVHFDALDQFETCALVHKHLLGLPMDTDRWKAYRSLNLQTDMPAMMRYVAAHQKQLSRSAHAFKEHFALIVARRPEDTDEGFTIKEESFDRLRRDGAHLFEKHCAAVGELDHEYLYKNVPLLRKLDSMGSLHIVTARSNGRMFGYLMSVLVQSSEEIHRTSATQTLFYASSDALGLGMKLQRASLAFLKQRGVSEVIMRAGPRGSGPKIGALYRRLGAKEFGSLYNLSLEGM